MKSFLRAKAALKRMEMKAHSIAVSSRDLFFFAHAVKAAWSDIVIIIITLPAPVEGLGRVLIITNILIDNTIIILVIIASNPA